MEIKVTLDQLQDIALLVEKLQRLDLEVEGIDAGHLATRDGTSIAWDCTGEESELTLTLSDKGGEA